MALLGVGLQPAFQDFGLLSCFVFLGRKLCPAIRKRPLKRHTYDPQEVGVTKRVQKGWSFSCTDQYCSRYMPGARGKEIPRRRRTISAFAAFAGMKLRSETIASALWVVLARSAQHVSLAP